MNFKVGDWVVPIGKDAVRGTIKQFSRSMEIEQMSHPKHYQQFFKLWKPKEGEWCWNEDYGFVLVKEVNIVHEDDIRIEYLTYNDYVTKYETTTLCCLESLEPFIGQLPTFLKDS